MFGRIDSFLLNKVATPIAHYVDWRWHRNNFDLAKWCFMASVLMLVLSPAIAFMQGLWLATPLLGAANAVMVRLAWKAITGFQKASEAYERNPHKIIVVLESQSMARLIFLIMPVMFSVVTIWLQRSFLDYAWWACNMWLAVEGVGLYFGGVLRPPSKRREAPQWFPDLAMHKAGN